MALTRISALFLVILFFSGIAGCGKIGPLYLPDESQAPSEESAQKITVDNSENKQD